MKHRAPNPDPACDPRPACLASPVCQAHIWERNLRGFATLQEASAWAVQHPNQLDAIIDLQQLPADGPAAGERAKAQAAQAVCLGTVHQVACAAFDAECMVLVQQLRGGAATRLALWLIGSSYLGRLSQFEVLVQAWLMQARAHSGAC